MSLFIKIKESLLYCIICGQRVYQKALLNQYLSFLIFLSIGGKMEKCGKMWRCPTLFISGFINFKFLLEYSYCLNICGWVFSLWKYCQNIARPLKTIYCKIEVNKHIYDFSLRFDLNCRNCQKFEKIYLAIST